MSQASSWPCTLSEGLDPRALCTIALISERQLPKWPTLGISIPTHNGSSNLLDAVNSLSGGYPGHIKFVVVSNGCDEPNRKALEALTKTLPNIEVLFEDTNLGYGMGANRGLERLKAKPGIDYYCVSNDDIIPATDCLCEMVHAMQELESLGHIPGVVGPVSNAVHGEQLVDIGHFSNYAEMMYRSEIWHRTQHDAARPANQLRGLFFLIHPDCLEKVGWFDPAFGIGNCEDDDHNVRTRLAGFTIWIAEGAFLYHKGSQTFRRMNVDYDALIQRNVEIFSEKWRVPHEAMHAIERAPEGVSVQVPLNAKPPVRENFPIKLNGLKVDLVHEASEVEFGWWVINQLRGKPREERWKLIRALN